jgi:C4-type Zn-finger protein
VACLMMKYDAPHDMDGQPQDKFSEMLDKLRGLYLGQGFPFTLLIRDPLGNSFISAHIGVYSTHALLAPFRAI